MAPNIVGIMVISAIAAAAIGSYIVFNGSGSESGSEETPGIMESPRASFGGKRMTKRGKRNNKKQTIKSKK